LTEKDPYTGIDLDHCRKPETGEIKPWARRIIAVLNSYTEVSPSETGVHIFVQGRLPGKGQKRDCIEMYDQARFFTVTGDHLPGTPTTVEDRQAGVEWLYTAMPIMAKLLADSGRREKFARLFTGDLSEYGSQSEADLALCSLAGKVMASAEQMDALMRLSGLYREKWDEMHGAQTYGQMTITKAREGKGYASGSQCSTKVADVVCLATVQPVAVDYLWRPYLPLGKLCSLEGDPGTGKSTLTATLAAYVTTGRLFPGELDTDREPRNVLFLQCEDDLADTFLPRLMAAGADISRVYALRGVVRLDDIRLEQSITEHQPALVVIDPIQGYIGAKTNINQSNEVRPIMERIRSLAETAKCTVLCVRHFGKNPDQRAIHRALGSVDFTAALRSVLQVEGERSPYTLTHAKANGCPKGSPLAYHIVSATVSLQNGGCVETSRIEWAEHTPTTEVLLSPTMRATVAALESLGGEGTLAAIATVLGIPKSTAVERLNTAISTGVVVKDTYGHYVLTLKRSVCD
jgi:archaellum biogenesis ATPase FlaH